MTRGYQHVNCGLTEQKRRVGDGSGLLFGRLASDVLDNRPVPTAGANADNGLIQVYLEPATLLYVLCIYKLVPRGALVRTDGLEVRHQKRTSLLSLLCSENKLFHSWSKRDSSSSARRSCHFSIKKGNVRKKKDAFNVFV